MTLPKPLQYLLSAWAVFWLVVCTGLCALVVMVLSLLGRPQERMQWPGRSWAKAICLAAFMRLRVHGTENLEPGANYVFACNHTSALDIIALFLVLPKNFRWLAKKELFEIPVFGPAMRRSGYIPIDRSNNRAALASLGRAAERIKDGASVLLFPEGTRTSGGTLLPFKSGGLSLAIRSRRPVAPMAIVGADKALAPKSKLLSPGVIDIYFGKPIPVDGLKMGDRDQLAQEVRAQVKALLQGAGIDVVDIDWDSLPSKPAKEASGDA